MKRRTFLSYSMAAGLSAPLLRAQEPARASAFSRLKKKLAEGQSATLLIISDSTGYLETSGTRRFIRWLAGQFPTHRTTELYWDEWTNKGATGPKEYRAPLVLAEGTTKATLLICNAVLPGAFAQAMIDGSRWGKMLAPLQSATPDLILWNHGHNHQANIPAANVAYGRGTILAPLGRVGLEFPKAPHTAIIQNPWRDNDGYERVRDWWKFTAEVNPSLTLVDGYTPFIDQGKNHDLYKDNVHPNDKGYELIYNQLVAAWAGSLPSDEVPSGTWANAHRDPIVENGDLADWTADVPRNWRLVNAAAVRKDTEHVFGQAAYSLALTGAKVNDGIQLALPKEVLERTRGKTVSIAVLGYTPREAEQDLQVKFTTSSSDQVTGTIQGARDNWKWIVLAGCAVPTEATFAAFGLYRSFSKPPTDVPFYIQKVVIVEGDTPGG